MDSLVIAPHPDDEVLGCGATIRKRVSAGQRVGLCIVTSGWEPMETAEFLDRREAEIKEAASLLGIDEVYELDYPAAKLDTIEQYRLNDDLSDVLAKSQPDTLYVPSPADLHRDHRITHEAALVAARPHRHRGLRILAYETLSETEWGTTLGSFEPTVYVDIADTLDEKLAAMEAYGSELREPPHPRTAEGIRAKAESRGAEVCLEAAEAFALVRDVER